MIKNKEYYTKQKTEYMFATQCENDLEMGRIKMRDVPFEYRTRIGYVYAKKALRYGVFGEKNQKEKRLFSELVACDIMKWKKEKERSSKYSEEKILYMIDALKSILHSCYAEGYFEGQINDSKSCK